MKIRSAWDRMIEVLMFSRIQTRDWQAPLQGLGGETTRKGNLDRPAEELDLSSVREFQDWRAMVRDSELDAVDICLRPICIRR